MKPSILFSTSYNPIVPCCSEVYNEVPLHYQVRPVDYNVNRVKKFQLMLKSLIETHKDALTYDSSHVILCNCGFEVPLYYYISTYLRTKYNIIAFDYLMPTSTRLDSAISRLVKVMSDFVVIRKGDEEALTKRFGIPASKVCFTKLPIAGDLPKYETVTESYVFSGGTAHRDWVTFCKALEGLDMPAKVVTNSSLLSLYGSVPSNIEEIGLLSPTAARKVMELSSMVCLSFHDTLLPSGPLVLLDAMAAGKAIIATSCNGTRDYITSGHNGFLYAPKDHGTLRNEAMNLHENPSLRKMYGDNARQTVIDEHLPKHFYKNLLTVLNIR